MKNSDIKDLLNEAYFNVMEEAEEWNSDSTGFGFFSQGATALIRQTLKILEERPHEQVYM